MNEAYVLDRELILDRLGGDEDILGIMIEMYLQDLDSYADNLKAALDAGDAKLLQREAHTVKGLLSSFADEPGTKAAFDIEQQAKTNDLSGLAAPIAALQARLYAVGEVLRAEMN
jgi:HPt (histidine-containing phosphotransfer) domain-containing protein